MTEPKFTPAPWTLHHGGDRKRITITAPGADNQGYWTGLDCEVDSDDKDQDTAIANGQLICAAPMLFAFVADYAEHSACSCGDWMTTPAAGKCSHCQAVELVARAIGEQPRTPNPSTDDPCS